MLDMFRRKTDAPEHNYLYGITGLTFLGSLLAAHAYSIPHIYTMGYLASSICCIGAICGLSNQATARIGNVLGITGVTGGIVATIASMGYSPAVFA